MYTFRKHFKICCWFIKHLIELYRVIVKGFWSLLWNKKQKRLVRYIWFKRFFDDLIWFVHGLTAWGLHFALNEIYRQYTCICTNNIRSSTHNALFRYIFHIFGMKSRKTWILKRWHVKSSSGLMLKRIESLNICWRCIHKFS